MLIAQLLEIKKKIEQFFINKTSFCFVFISSLTIQKEERFYFVYQILLSKRHKEVTALNLIFILFKLSLFFQREKKKIKAIKAI